MTCVSVPGMSSRWPGAPLQTPRAPSLKLFSPVHNVLIFPPSKWGLTWFPTRPALCLGQQRAMTNQPWPPPGSGGYFEGSVGYYVSGRAWSAWEHFCCHCRGLKKKKKRSESGAVTMSSLHPEGPGGREGAVSMWEEMPHLRRSSS